MSPRRVVARALATLALAALATVAAPARAEESPESLFASGNAALARGAYGEAIDAFESLADRGFVHPDASFDRALAYIGRVRANAEQAGDLGRAAAALEETLLARADDAGAEQALDVVRAEVARRRARGSTETEVDSRPTVERALVGLASESSWALLAAAASAWLTIALVLRRAKGAASQLAGVIGTPIGVVALLVLIPLTLGARHLRLATSVGVVVTGEARMTDERGAPAKGGPIPEAARVEIDEQRGALVRVRWGTLQGWTQASSVRVLAPFF